uniref:Uncharacterized protein n=1 Tax=Heterorhabditis bacteriophora TaxID=37862 RepID=A0A1I7WXI4_HETBA
MDEGLTLIRPKMLQNNNKIPREEKRKDAKLACNVLTKAVIIPTHTLKRNRRQILKGRPEANPEKLNQHNENQLLNKAYMRSEEIAMTVVQASVGFFALKGTLLKDLLALRIWPVCAAIATSMKN